MAREITSLFLLVRRGTDLHFSASADKGTTVSIQPQSAKMALGIFWATVSLVVFMLITLLDMMGYFKPKNHFVVEGKVRSAANFFSEFRSDGICRLS